MQRERGKSALFINDKVPRDEIIKQRQFVDDSLIKTKAQAVATSLSSDKKLQLDKYQEELKILRSDVDLKIPSSESTKRYTTLISGYLDLQVQAARISKAEGAQISMLSLASLEYAKENTGRLRAFLTGIISTNAPITAQQVSTLETFRSNIEANLFSNTLTISDKAANMINNYRDFPDWKKSLVIYRTVIDKSHEGQFGLSAPEFFSAITNSIDELGKIVSTEVNIVSDNMEETHQKSLFAIQIVSAVAVFLIFIVLILSLTVIKSITKPLVGMVSDMAQIEGSIGQTSEHLKIQARRSLTKLRNPLLRLKKRWPR